MKRNMLHKAKPIWWIIFTTILIGILIGSCSIFKPQETSPTEITATEQEEPEGEIEEPITLEHGPGDYYDLLVIIPYKETSDIAIQEELDWITYADELADYKTRTGIRTDVMTLDEINDGYTGVDEQERIKRAIYQSVINDGVDYVLLVGDYGVFPVRYQFRGYLADGSPAYSFNDGYCHGAAPCIFAEAYRFHPIDAYYSNLWDDADPARTFEDWNQDGDFLYGEMYCNNVRGTDGNTLHPDVALGRLPADEPIDFINYISKVMYYENIAEGMPTRRAMLIGAEGAGGYGGWGTRDTFGATLGGAYEITYLIEEDGNYTDQLPDGTTHSIADADQYVSDYINGNSVLITHYAGHGSPGNWSQIGFNDTLARYLDNRFPPVVAASSCSTARFAQQQVAAGLPSTPYPGGNEDSMAEGFLSQSEGGVIYLGAVTTMQPHGNALIQAFFEEIVAGATTAGEAYLAALDTFIADNSYDTYTAGEEIYVGEWPDPAYDRGWSYYDVAKFYHVYKMELFGDPSLRLNGSPVLDRTPPSTTAIMDNWVNNQNRLEDVDRWGTYYHPVVLSAYDDSSGTGIFTSRYLHWWGSAPRSEWWDGSEFDIPIQLTRDMEGEESEVRYYSIDRAGNREDVQVSTIGYDFTPPVSSIVTSGTTSPTTVDGEYLVDGHEMTITADDENSGVRSIWYTPGWGRGEIETWGDRLEIRRGRCMPPISEEIEFWAEDRAGNLEARQRATLEWDYMAPMDLWFCLEGWQYMEPLEFPPSARDLFVELRFHETLADWIPQTVLFEYSGPITQASMPDDWALIGQADHDPGTQSWVLNWDTQAAGIQNGWYALRPITAGGVASRYQAADQKEYESFVVLIDNVSKDRYSLSLKQSNEPLKPGEPLVVSVTFENKELGEMKNAVMGLVFDHNLLKDPEQVPLPEKKELLKPGEPWTVEFELLLAEQVGEPNPIRLDAFVTSEEYAYLRSEPIFVTQITRDITVSGRVMDTLGRGLSALLSLKGEKGAWEAKTDADGAFRFEGIPSGEYNLNLAEAPAGYRLIVPKEETYQVIAAGLDVEKKFTLASPDLVAPTITAELPWHVVAQYGQVYGLAYDQPFGTDIATVKLAFTNPARNNWLNGNGKWVEEETWLEPDVVYPLEDFLKTGLEKILGKLPEEVLKAEQEKLEGLSGKLYTNRLPMAWAYSLPDPSVLEDGWVIILVQAQDNNKNMSQTELVNTKVNADFSAEVVSGPAPLKVNFKNLSSGPLVFFEWDFGDGSTSEQQDPIHEYTEPGLYTVTLTVSGPDGFDVETKTELIEVTAK